MEHKTSLPGYYTTSEAAKVLGYLSGDPLKVQCANKKIPAYKVANVWLIPSEWVENEKKNEIKPQGNRGVTRK